MKRRDQETSRRAPNPGESPRAQRPDATAARSVRTVLLVSGMRDNVSREEVAGLLETVPGVREVSVNLYRARATVVHDAWCNPGLFLSAIEISGCSAAVVRDE